MTPAYVTQFALRYGATDSDTGKAVWAALDSIRHNTPTKSRLL